MTQIQTREKCSACNGEGTTDPTKINACLKCLGAGYVYSEWTDCEIERLPVVDNGKVLRYVNTVTFTTNE